MTLILLHLSILFLPILTILKHVNDFQYHWTIITYFNTFTLFHPIVLYLFNFCITAIRNQNIFSLPYILAPEHQIFRRDISKTSLIVLDRCEWTLTDMLLYI